MKHNLKLLQRRKDEGWHLGAVLAQAGGYFDTADWHMVLIHIGSFPWL